jgi:hypothetical protein
VSDEHTSDGMRITNYMIYSKLMEINENQIAMRVELDQRKDHEPRIRFLEKKLWMFTGGAGLIGGLITAVVQVALQSKAGI